MSGQAEVHSIQALKDFRVALSLYAEDALAALGAVESEVRRTVQWLHQDRPYYWQEQIKRRREQVASARSEVFRRQLQKKPDYSPSMSEPMENLRRAEASLQDAEKRLAAVRKWQPAFQQAALEYHGTIQRIKDLAATDVPRAVYVLTRIVDALEAYLQVAPPTLAPAGSEPATTSSASAAGAKAPTQGDLEALAVQVMDTLPEPDAPPSPIAGVATVREDDPGEPGNQFADVPGPAA